MTEREIVYSRIITYAMILIMKSQANPNLIDQDDWYKESDKITKMMEEATKSLNLVS